MCPNWAWNFVRTEKVLLMKFEIQGLDVSPLCIAPPNTSPPGAYAWKIALKYKVKQSKHGKFTSNYKTSPSDPYVDKPSEYKRLQK